MIDSVNTSLCYCHVCLQRVNNLKPELTKYFVAFAFITLFSVGTGTAGFLVSLTCVKWKFCHKSYFLSEFALILLETFI